MAKNKVQNRPFGMRDKVGYMFGDFGCNMSFQLISSFLMLFVTQGLGLSYLHWMIIIVVAKIFDAINDPIIGAIVDSRAPTKHGKYRPWILWGAFGIALTTVLLFIDVRAFPYWGRFFYCLVVYMLWSVAYTAANVPYGSLNAALTTDPGQRAQLSSLRSIGAGLAMLPVLVILPKVVYDGETNALLPEPFVWCALACGVVGIFGFVITYLLCKERHVVAAKKEKIKLGQTLKSFFKNKSALALSLASFAQLVFIMSYTATTPLVFQYYFGDPKFNSIGSILIMVPMMVFIPFMSKLSVKYGKKEISAWPNVIGALIMVIMLFIPFPQNNVGIWIYTVMYMLGMMGGGTFMLATWSMVADCVDEQEILSGKREEASVYATYSFARKVAQGVGQGLIALVFFLIGVKTNPENPGAPIPENSEFGVANGILKTSIILPLIGFIVVFLVLLFLYSLKKSKVESNTELLKEKHKNDVLISDVVDLTPTRVFYEEEAAITKDAAINGAIEDTTVKD